MSLSFTKNIIYYNKDNESFADVTIGNFTFNCRVSGLDNPGDAVILLHGFPETSRMWHDLMKVLDLEGFKVIAPDQRGYSKNARPMDVSDYTIDKLSDDVLRIADAFDLDSFHLIGHDWGSAVGWYIVSINSDRILTWSALSVPHLDAFLDAIKNDKEQQKKSRYISLFRKPFLPELYFKIFGYKYLKDIWRYSLDNEKELYLETFKQKGALKSTLNWYRANFNGSDYKVGNIYTPTLIIYGIKDMAVGEKCVNDSKKYLLGKHRIEKLDVGHWLIQESFDSVTESILNHIKN